jgi:hypothetical protein
MGKGRTGIKALNELTGVRRTVLRIPKKSETFIYIQELNIQQHNVREVTVKNVLQV